MAQLKLVTSDWLVGLIGYNLYSNLTTIILLFHENLSVGRKTFLPEWLYSFQNQKYQCIHLFFFKISFLETLSYLKMTTPLSEPICVRNSLLQHILMGRRNLFDDSKGQCQLTKDGLMDAILVLHDYFSSLHPKDKHMANFVEQCKFKVLQMNYYCCGHPKLLIFRSSSSYQTKKNKGKCSWLWIQKGYWKGTLWRGPSC